LVLTLGYAFAWLAIGLALTRVCPAPIAFGGIAALHLIAGGIAISAAIKRMKKTRLMRESAAEASRSVSALTRPLERHAS
jgi:hypothetical protein